MLLVLLCSHISSLCYGIELEVKNHCFITILSAISLHRGNAVSFSSASYIRNKGETKQSRTVPSKKSKFAEA